MDPLWIGIAFVLGFATRQVGLPPLIGYLAAGFVLRVFGVEGGMFVEELADFGVMLLLFSIGLKLRVKSLLRAEIWAGASAHMLITVLVFGAIIYVLALTGVSLFAPLDLTTSLLIAFALSFSSTVFAVKVLEDKGEMASIHARVAIGILIVQDIIAVVFLTASMGKIPSPWAFALVGLAAVRPILMMLMSRCGHGELLVMFGLLLTTVGGGVFEAVGLKPDLGALVFGILVASHARASELARDLMSFKDVFLVGFFLSIGLASPPTAEALAIAVLLVTVVPFKVALFFWLLTRFRLRARTSTLASFSLANYSEFGLIVGTVAVANGWITAEWLAAIAIALSLTFVLASPLNSAAHAIYARFDRGLRRFELPDRLPDDRPIDAGDAEIVIFGMGRVGTSTYDEMHERFGDAVVGVDSDDRTVDAEKAAGRKVLLGDATDSDFWERAQSSGKIRLVMLTMPNHRENMYVARRLSERGFDGYVTATAKYDDEVAALDAEGVDAAFNIYAEAGSGFAAHVCERLGSKLGGKSG